MCGPGLCFHFAAFSSHSKDAQLPCHAKLAHQDQEVLQLRLLTNWCWKHGVFDTFWLRVRAIDLNDPFLSPLSSPPENCSLVSAQFKT